MEQRFIPTLSGAGAGAVTAVLCSPLDVAKVRIQVQASLTKGRQKYDGLLPTLRVMLAEEGLRGWYKGLTPALICIPVFWGVYFGAYEKAKHELKIMTGSDQHILSAVCAGALTDIVTNPFWVVRTRMQTQVMHVEEGPMARTMQETFRCIYRKEGVYAFWRGLTASFLGLTHVAIQFPLYERLKVAAQKRRGIRPGEETMPELICISAAAKMTSSLITYPHEVLRARMQDTRGPRLTLRAAILNITRNEGRTALWTGFRVNVFRVLPSCVATFVSYELLTRKFKKILGVDQPR